MSYPLWASVVFREVVLQGTTRGRHLIKGPSDYWNLCKQKWCCIFQENIFPLWMCLWSSVGVRAETGLASFCSREKSSWECVIILGHLQTFFSAVKLSSLIVSSEFSSFRSSLWFLWFLSSSDTWQILPRQYLHCLPDIHSLSPV